MECCLSITEATWAVKIENFIHIDDSSIHEIHLDECKLRKLKQKTTTEECQLLMFTLRKLCEQIRPKDWDVAK